MARYTFAMPPPPRTSVSLYRSPTTTGSANSILRVACGIVGVRIPEAVAVSERGVPSSGQNRTVGSCCLPQVGHAVMVITTECSSPLRGGFAATLTSKNHQIGLPLLLRLPARHLFRA